MIHLRLSLLRLPGFRGQLRLPTARRLLARRLLDIFPFLGCCLMHLRRLAMFQSLATARDLGRVPVRVRVPELVPGSGLAPGLELVRVSGLALVAVSAPGRATARVPGLATGPGR